MFFKISEADSLHESLFAIPVADAEILSVQRTKRMRNKH